MTSQFQDFGLNSQILQALQDKGYQEPTPIQADTIPPLLEGKDLVGQAQTGTGKTAAFALPFLHQISTDKHPQVLVLAPTRELAMQVAQSFQTYARYLDGIKVCCIYGGQSYTPQLKQLKQGPQVIVGTPGRIIDHLKQGNMSLDQIRFLVLDEADEMLRMGFQEDVEWILKHVPSEHQTALFSATMPKPIRHIAKAYLKNPVEITHSVKLKAADTIEEQYWLVKGMSKFEALTRLIESEDPDGVMVFVRTRTSTVKIAEDLEAQGYLAAPLNGDLSQKQREYTVKRFKQGHIDVLIATDVAARGLHVDRVSHVVNFDMPFDHETYIHRIGRTGRAGQSGKALLFVSPQERKMLARLERSTGKKIDAYWIPDKHQMQAVRQKRFQEKVLNIMEHPGIDEAQTFLARFQVESGQDWSQIAAALAVMQVKDSHFFAPPKAPLKKEKRSAPSEGFSKKDAPAPKTPKAPKGKQKQAVDKGMERFRLGVGHAQGASPELVRDTIAHNLDLHPSYIGNIEIYPDHSTVDLPDGLPRVLLKRLKKVQIGEFSIDARRMKGLESLKKLKGKDGFKVPKRKGFKAKSQKFKGKKGEKGKRPKFT